MPIPYVEINRIMYTGDFSSPDHFQTNVVPNAHTGITPFGGNPGNPLGNPTINFSNALEYFNIYNVRFPAGQGDEIFSQHGIIVDGDISSFFREFLKFVSEQGITVSLVVPVFSLAEFGGVDTPQLYDQLEQLASIIGTEFPGIVTQIELGNEYWSRRDKYGESLESVYGESAALALAALESGFSQSGGSPQYILQAAGNLAGTHGNRHDDANLQIQTGFESIADPAHLDGIVRNFYWMDPDPSAFHNATGIFNEDRNITDNLRGPLHSTWRDWAGDELIEVVGEYNIANRVARTIHQNDLSEQGASMLLEHYTNLVDAGVNTAYVWPLIHNTMNAMIHTHEPITTVSVDGYNIATNNSRVAMFDLLRQSVINHELVEFEWNGTHGLEITGFANFNQAAPSYESVSKVVFLSSREVTTQTFSVDISSFVSSYASLEALTITTEDSPSHHGDAIIGEFSQDFFDGDGTFIITLEPYEVLMVEFIIPENPVVNNEFDVISNTDQLAGTNSDDILVGAAHNDQFMGYDGRDLLTGGNGHDSLGGGSGEDTIYGGFGLDHMEGGFGDDDLHGNSGSDTLDGGWGNDYLLGGTGHDLVEGGSGEDFAAGGWGDDRVLGSGGFDVLFGDGGTDTLLGGDQADNLYGGLGNDSVVGGAGLDRLFGGVGDDTLRGGDGNDGHFGESGNDLLLGGTGADRLFGHGDDDRLDGGSGDDSIWGGGAFDTIDGGLGDDWLSGGINADVFVFNSGHGNDVISDFDAKNDFEVIQLSDFYGIGMVAPELNFSTLNFSETGSGVVVYTPSMSSIFLSGVELQDLGPEDFVF